MYRLEAASLNKQRKKKIYINGNYLATIGEDS
jgi:hypothetical protein